MTEPNLAVPAWLESIDEPKVVSILRIVEGRLSRSCVLQRGRNLLIGRDESADLRLACAKVSRKHALLHIGDVVEIEDLESSNGTVVSGDRVKPGLKRILRLGEVAALGSAMIFLGSIRVGSNVPDITTPASLLGNLFTPLTNGMLAIFGFSFSQPMLKECLASLLGGIFSTPARLAEWSPQSWRLACVVHAHADAEACRELASARLESWGFPATVDMSCLPLPVDEQGGRMPPPLRDAIPPRRATGRFVAQSKPMVELLALSEKVADTELPALILGETGAGKECVASFIHEHSKRRGKPFLRINCATLGESLFESELFGHESGSFTGARQRKIGLLETAQGGTVFLDEVGDMPVAAQAKILRAIEHREFMRVGGTRVIPIDIRYISATNREITESTPGCNFREDLFFRLAGFVLTVPALRERPEDIPLLANSFLEESPTNRPLAFSVEAIEKLCAHSWPGNVRELRNVVMRAKLLCDDWEVRPHHILFDKTATTPPRAENQSDQRHGFARKEFPFHDPVAARLLIANALESTKGNQTHAARSLGISRRALVNRLADFGFSRPRSRQVP